MTFYTPAAFSALICIPAIIFLYLLKQRHQDFTVSSLHLWEEVLRDIEANAPWQKLRKNILMLLQIAAVVLLTFALARPFINGTGSSAPGIVIVMDTSFSMQAEDIKPNRFEAARRNAVRLVEGLRPGTPVTLITAGGVTSIEDNMTTDKSSLIRKINGLKVSNSAGDLEEASALLLSITNQHPGTRAAVFTDREVTVPGLDIEVYNLNRSGDNYAVTLLSHKKLRDSTPVLSRVANYSPREADIPVSLYADGRVIDARTVRTGPGAAADVLWNNVPQDAVLLECRIDAQDSLPADNVAYDVVNETKPARIALVSDKNIFLEKAVSLMNGVELFKSDAASMPGLKGYDLYIFDGFLPGKLPEDGSIMVFNPPEGGPVALSGTVENPVLKKSDHKLFKYIEKQDFAISRAKSLSLPVWGEAVLKAGESILAYAGAGDSRRIIVFGFDLHDSDITLTPAFPILMTNCFEWLLPARISSSGALYPGRPAELSLDPEASRARIIAPSGASSDIAMPLQGGIFSGTEEIGAYILEQQLAGSKTLNYFAVNPPAPQESNLQPLPGSSAQAGSDGGANAGKSAAAGAGAGRNLRTLFLWFLLPLLLIEWWVYSYGL